MNIPRNRWIESAVTLAALCTSLGLCSAASIPLSRSIASALLFASSFFGIQRIYAALVDVLVMALAPQPPAGRPLA